MQLHSIVHAEQWSRAWYLSCVFQSNAKGICASASTIQFQPADERGEPPLPSIMPDYHFSVATLPLRLYNKIRRQRSEYLLADCLAVPPKHVAATGTNHGSGETKQTNLSQMSELGVWKHLGSVQWKYLVKRVQKQTVESAAQLFYHCLLEEAGTDLEILVCMHAPREVFSARYIYYFSVLAEYSFQRHIVQRQPCNISTLFSFLVSGFCSRCV